MSPDKGKRSSKSVRKRTRPLSDIERAANILEDQASAAGAIAQAQDLAKEAHQRSAAQAADALRGFAESIAVNLDLSSLVRAILEAAIHFLGAERGALLLGEGARAGLVPVVALSITGRELEKLEEVSRTILERAKQGEVVVTVDAVNDERFRDIPSIRLQKVHSVLCAPLMLRGVPLGVLYLDARATHWAFPKEARQQLEVFARLAAAAIENARLYGELKQENARLRRNLTALGSMDRPTTVSPALAALERRIALAVQVDLPVLIRGEEGTGKEWIARTIHERGARAGKPFVTCNCEGIPHGLAEGLLLGHRPGAFIGSQREIPGLLRDASGGALYLDGITALEIDLQERIFGALTRGIVRLAGSRKETEIDVRLMASTGEDVHQLVRAGQLSRNLYDLINQLEVYAPALRERPEEVPLLAERLLSKHAEAVGRDVHMRFSTGALDYLQEQVWPGNLDELDSFVLRLALGSPRPTIDVALVKRYLGELPALEEISPAASAPSADVQPILAQERELLSKALARTGWNKSRAARMLGMNRGTFLRRMKRLGIPAEK